MASKQIQICLVLVVITMFAIGAIAQSGCSNVILSMASCLNYVTGSSTTPSSSCCSSLANVVQTQPQCLCTVLNGGGSIGISINSTLALALPGACNVQTPPVSRCDVVNGPAMSPLASPENSPEGNGAPVGSPAVTGSKTSPESGNADITKMHLQLVAFLLFTASYAMSFSSF